MDKFDQDWADMLSGNYTMDEVAAGDDIQPPAAYDNFEQDWADMSSGRQTFDEVAAEVQPYVERDTSATDWGPYAGLMGANYGGYTTGQAQDRSSPAYDKSYGTDASTGLTSLLKALLKKDITNADIKKWAPLLAGLVSATGVGRAKVTPAGYTGMGSGQSLIPKYTATRAPLAMPAPRAYGAGAQGQQYFAPVQYAAKGGIMGLSDGGFVVPADVVSHLGNGSSEAGLRVLMQQLGATPIKGEGDGMSDSIDAHIDGNQPAKVANDEAYVSPDKVAAIGGGDASKGAKKLYAMMDKIREARTGNKEQGKQIDAGRFLPGGAVKGYADGGVTAPSGTTGISENLAGWAGDYVTNMLGQGQALAQAPYQAYTGALTAGTSPLSQEAYGQAQNFQVPGSVGQAADTMGQLSQTSSSYTPTQFGNQFQAPGAYQGATFGNQYQAVAPTQATQFTNTFNAPTTGPDTQFTNQYEAPEAYAAANIGTDQFSTAAAQQYMNPYLQMSLQPQIAEAQRQSQLTQMQNATKATQAGAFGGSRQALMDTETQRNLGTNLANIVGQGYNTAYTNAASQFTSDQARALQAQQATEQSRQYGASQSATAAQLQAQYGMSAQQAQEAARQFSSGQNMTAAQLQAQYGMSAQQAQEAARQFQTSTAVQQAQNMATSGLAALQAGEQSRQFGAQQDMTSAQLSAQYGLAGQQAMEQSQQFGANLGLQSTQQQLAAAQAQGALGISSGQLGLQGISQLGQFGQQQQTTEQAALDAQKAQFEAERDNPYKMVQFQQSLLQGLPLKAQDFTTAQTSALTEAIRGAGGVMPLLQSLGYDIPE